MSQSQPEPLPTTIAGRYQVLQKLGAGAFGTVYKAKDSVLGRMLAIKTIRLEGLAAASADLDELLKRFKQEATAGAALKHPNIVTVYDIGESEGASYLAMEYVDGVGLDRIIVEAGRLPIDRAASLAAQVADALGYAHQNKVIHRDIKPANIMIEAGERVKVTDFGIARVTDSGENLTQTGGLLGTPSYMSPEQAKGLKVDGRSDLFSVGCVLYELLAGRKAFTGDNITGILFKIIAEEPTPIRELDPHLPDEMVAVLEKALAKDPDARYQTGRELAEDLLALSQPGHVPTLRQSDAPTSPAVALDGPTVSSPPTLTAAGGGAGSAESPTAPVAPTQISPTPPAPPPLPPPVAEPAAPDAAPARRPTPAPARRSPAKRGSRLPLGIAAGLAVLILAVGLVWVVLGRGAPAPLSTPAPPEATPLAEAAPPPPEAASETPSDASPAAEADAAPPPTPAPTAVAAAAPPPRAAAPAAAPRPVAPADPGATAPAAVPTTPQQPPPAAPDSFLDELPEEPPDGREAGGRVAEGFRSDSGTSSFGTNRNLRRRPRIPPHSPAEKPAVRALLWIYSAQRAHHRRTGRYGSLSELIQAGDLPLSGSHQGDSFSRAGYRLTVTPNGDRFRADAQPLAPTARAFFVNDSGKVIVAD